MRTRINLKPVAFSAVPNNQQLNSIFRHSLPLFLVVLCLLLLPGNNASETPIQSFASLKTFQDLRYKCGTIDVENNLEELKNNFLTNSRIENASLRETFQHAGLSHLLALSGGQTGPAAAFICFSIVGVLIGLLSLKRKMVRFRLILIIGRVGILSELAVILFLVGLYQSTGALNRVFSFRLARIVAYAATFQVRTVVRKHIHMIPHILATLPWMLAFLIGKNPTSDLSFLLSSLGALTAHLSSSVTSLLFSVHKDKTNRKSPPVFRAIKDLVGTIARWITMTALASAIMCIFCFQLWPINNLVNKIMANLLAGPVVLLIITPGALVINVSLLLNSEIILNPATSFFSFGTFVFLKIGQTFAEQGITRDDSSRMLFLKQRHYEWYDHPYLLLLILIICMSGLNHWIHERKIRRLKTNPEISAP
jgi:hypothetical protein